MERDAGRVVEDDGDDIEAEVFGAGADAAGVGADAAAEGGAFDEVDGAFGGGEVIGGAGFDLDEDKAAFVAGDEIDLAEAMAVEPVAVENLVAEAAQVVVGKILGGAAEGLMAGEE